jgi:predicted permease
LFGVALKLLDLYRIDARANVSETVKVTFLGSSLTTQRQLLVARGQILKWISSPVGASILRDLRYAVRSFLKTPGFTIVVVATCALAIGVNAAVFTLFDLFFRPLPDKNPSTLVQVELGHRAFKNEPLASFPEYVYLRDQVQTLSALAAVNFGKAVLSGRDASTEPQEINCQYASGNFFSVLGASTILGRTFGPEEGAGATQEPVAVLSYHLWQTTFGGDAAIIGKTVLLNRSSLVVIGVTSRDFVGFGLEEQDGESPGAFAPRPDPDLWAPLAVKGKVRGDSYDPLTALDDRWLTVYGRLAPGRTLEQARAEVAVLLKQFDGAHPEFDRMALRAGFDADPKAKAYVSSPSEVRVAPLSVLGEFPSDAWTIMAVVMAATGMVLLIACSNLANLLLARAAAARKEIGLRLCLGASRGRLIRQMLTGNLLLALTGGGLGLLLAWWSLRVFVVAIALSYPGLPKMSRIVLLNLAPDSRVLGFTFILTVMATIAFGLVPALRATDGDLAAMLKQDDTGCSNRGSASWLRKGLVMVEVSLCLTLLIGAGLALHGFSKALELSQSPGFETRNVLIIDPDLRSADYDGPGQQQFRDTVEERLAALPGVQHVGRAYNLPRGEILHLEVNSEISDPNASRTQTATYNSVSQTYFDTVGVPIVAGRGFNAQDIKGEAGVVIVSKTTAHNLWPNKEAVGQTLGSERNKKLQVVGVAEDVRNVRGEIPPLFMYMPLAADESARLLVRTSGSAQAMEPTILGTIRALDPRVLVKVKTMSDSIYGTEELWYSRVVSALSLCLGLLALLLAALGVYGVISYSVGQRTHEMGVRMALGASRKEILRLIVGQGMLPVVAGMIFGLAGGAVISRVMSSLLFGVGRLDPLSYLGASLFLVAMALLAVYLPARRATKIEPWSALRSR